MRSYCYSFHVTALSPKLNTVLANIEQYKSLILLKRKCRLHNYTKSDWLILINLHETVEPQLSIKATLRTKESGRCV